VARPPVERDPGAPEPISVRYLIPVDRGSSPVERIHWTPIGPGTAGWDLGAAAANAAIPKRGGDKVALATKDHDDAPALAERSFEPDATFQEYEVDSAATRDPASGGPVYPDDLRQKGVQGEVVVEFTVDTTGHADSATFTVVEATHPEFAAAVREALPRMLFTPAVTRGRRVRQLVRLPMKFKLLTETASQGT
jgi:protein TonB